MTRRISYSTAAKRWAGLGPYYAMFPTNFADRVVRKYTDEGDLVIDPFAGRGTAVFSAASQRRRAIGIELNPVGYVYAKAKLGPADYEQVANRLKAVARASSANFYRDEAKALPVFFRKCFSFDVRSFLLAARRNLDWKRCVVDRTTMAILLVYLHGKEGAALSNQMRQTKSMSPDYAIRWWAEHEASPPDVDPLEFLTSRLDWRYAKGVPNCTKSSVYLGNSLTVLPRLADLMSASGEPKAKLLFTSPPYFAITNYHYDQWLRLWLLGGPPTALRTGNAVKGKFENRVEYKNLLASVFCRAKKLLHRDAVIYVRTDARKFTRTTTIDVLKELFPTRSIAVRRRPILGTTQTKLFGDSEQKAGEVDLVLEPN